VDACELLVAGSTFVGASRACYLSCMHWSKSAFREILSGVWLHKNDWKF